MAEDIVKLLSPPGSPITLVFRPRRRYPIPRGTTSVGAQNTRGWEKFVIFDRNRRLSRKRYEIGPWLLVNAYMKSYALYRMVTFSRTFTDPYPGFQGHCIFYVEYLKNFFAPG